MPPALPGQPTSRRRDVGRGFVEVHRAVTGDLTVTPAQGIDDEMVATPKAAAQDGIVTVRVESENEGEHLGSWWRKAGTWGG